MNHLLYVYLVLCGVLSYGCATNQSAKVRGQRPVTIGLGTSGMGAMYRPTDSLAVGAASGGSSSSSTDLAITSASNQKALGVDTYTIDESQTNVTTVYGHYFPWNDSAFYMGLSVKQQQDSFIYQVAGESGFSAAPQKTGGNLDGAATNLSSPLAQVSLDTSSVQIKLPVGWSWIWQNGISLMLELGGPVIYFDQRSDYSLDGKSENVDEKKRDIITSVVVDDVGKDSAISPLLNIGYSF